MGEKILEIPQYRNKKVTDKDNGGGGGGMDKYATLQDLDNLQEQLQLKLEITEKNLKLEMQDMLRQERAYHKETRDFNLKLIGVGIAVMTLLLKFL